MFHVVASSATVNDGAGLCDEHHIAYFGSWWWLHVVLLCRFRLCVFEHQSNDDRRLNAYHRRQDETNERDLHGDNDRVNGARARWACEIGLVQE